MLNQIVHPLALSDITTIAETGGACAGKSTVLAQSTRHLQDKGVHACVVPEIATEFATHGLSFGDFGSPEDFQTQILLASVEREYRYHQAMKCIKAKHKVILTDRGRLDGSAYISPDVFFKMAEKLGYDAALLGEVPYKGVIYLRSLAYDAPHLYTCANNIARRETVEEAKELDERTLRSWIHHPHLVVISNTDGNGGFIDLQTKVRKSVAAITHILGIPVPIEIERKFHLKNEPLISVPHENVSIVQYYIKTPEGDERIRMRTWRGITTCYRTIKKTLPGFSGSFGRYETESIITASEFTRLLRFAKPDCCPVTKTRKTFVYKDQYFELDVFLGLHQGLVMLEIELTDANDQVSLPDFLGKSRDVTDDLDYSNYSLARNPSLSSLWKNC
ncbi:MAG: AAA family ATPase [Candidatus Pacebacteria bacterium]|nr:AAA family ATPase [Candidatus Paceibacterota bacterium]